MRAIHVFLFLYLATVCNFIANAQTTGTKKITEIKSSNTYNVFYSVSEDSLSNDVWDSFNTISPLHAFWENRKPDGSKFQAYYTDRFFCFRFQVKDSALTSFQSTTEETVAKGDRVELFFSNDLSLKKYYCVEISPNGNVLDYSAVHYRKFDDTWNLDGLEVYPSVTSTGYQVTGKIPLDFFYKLTGKTSLAGAKIFTGVFRAETSPDQHSETFSWFSWVPPNSVTSDFHIVSAFGVFQF